MDLLKDRLFACMVGAFYQRNAEEFRELISLTLRLLELESETGQPVRIEWDNNEPKVCKPFECEDNDPKRMGLPASRPLFFNSRFSVRAMHTHSDKVEWVVFDGEIRDTIYDPPSVVARCATLLAAVEEIQNA